MKKNSGAIINPLETLIRVHLSQVQVVLLMPYIFSVVSYFSEFFDLLELSQSLQVENTLSSSSSPPLPSSDSVDGEVLPRPLPILLFEVIFRDATILLPSHIEVFIFSFHVMKSS